MKKVLTIAGSDCSGGAGIQADIKTITVHKLYAMSAITALTAQNTTGVYGIMEVPPDFLEKQLDSIFSDIYPDAIKIGMVSSKGLIEKIALKLISEKAKNIVLDPVMISTSGCKLLVDDAATALVERLIPIASIITPNIPEAEVLSEIKITSADQMVYAAEKIAQYYNGAILIKGGHQLNEANDLLYQNGRAKWFYGERIDNNNTHGTGCTLSSAIASNMAMGYNLSECVCKAKKFISGALKMKLDLGNGNGPLDHTFAIDKVNNSTFPA